jgi:hypothetical protein
MRAVVVALSNLDSFPHFLATIPRTIDDVLDRPTVSALINAGATKNKIEACLALAIAQSANKLTVGGNLRQGQALQLAIQLIGDYPNESLEDFCLCLKLGVKGTYGDIFRFDDLVVNQWFKTYLENKYQVIEDKLMREKDNQYAAIMRPDPSLPIQEAQTLSEEAQMQKVKERFKAWREAVEAISVKPVLPMTEDDIRKEGQTKPRKAAPYTPTVTLAEFNARQKLIRAASKFYEGKRSFNLQTFEMDGVCFMAESESDAKEIYNIATSE